MNFDLKEMIIYRVKQSKQGASVTCPTVTDIKESVAYAVASHVSKLVREMVLSGELNLTTDWTIDLPKDK